MSLCASAMPKRTRRASCTTNRIEHAETGRLLVTGETTHVCVDAEFRPRAIPDDVVQALGC